MDAATLARASAADALLIAPWQYPRLEGRFPQVSGVSFEFDPSQPAGSRVVDGSMRVGDEEVGDERCAFPASSMQRPQCSHALTNTAPHISAASIALFPARISWSPR